MQSVGLRVSVGLSAPSACAAIRAKVANPTATRYRDSNGEWITGHVVPYGQSWRGSKHLAQMAADAIDECVGSSGVAGESIPLILCVAGSQASHPDLDERERLFKLVSERSKVRFGSGSGVVVSGRVSLAKALENARRLLYEDDHRHVLIAGSDSLLHTESLRRLDRRDRLLTTTNSNGLMPGEGAGAVIVSKPTADSKALICGVGIAAEPATVESDLPLRGDGLTSAIRSALGDAGCSLHDLDLRVTDLSGEQYYFKEAAIALGRILRRRKEAFELWHPAECVGETGVVAGFVGLCVAMTALAKNYAPGLGILLHQSDDDGQRAAIVLFGKGR